MRNPKKPAPKIEELHSSFNRQWVTETREYEVITFLMGGGVEPYEVDPITTVRAAEIKGWLRYWWRATRGGMFNGNLDKMRAREAQIWGWSASGDQGGPSQVVIEVTLKSPGRQVTQVKTHKGNVSLTHWSSPYSYVAFPLQTDEKPVFQGVRFELLIRYPKQWQTDVHAALWAWETFGGIGARTRRGFGALKRVDKNARDPAMTQVANWIRQHLNQYAGASPWPQDVPHLSPQMALLVKYSDQDPFRVWQRLIAALKAFRQDRYPGSGNRPGRSKWPEPDEIRRLTGNWIPKHQPKHSVRKFPRGQMGLPIVFHFKDKGDPQDAILQGANHDRWASRLILKVIPCQGGYVGLAAVLDGPNRPPGGWKLTGSVTKRVNATLTPKEAQQIPMLNGNPDVLQAFLDFLKSK